MTDKKDLTANAVTLKTYSEKLKVEKLDENEVNALTKEERDQYDAEQINGRLEITTKPVPKGFILKWKSPYTADEQITLFENKKWFANSLKMVPKPYWSGDFDKPYTAYRNDLELKYLIQRLKDEKTDKSLSGQAIAELEKEINKNPTNKDELEAILAKLQTPEWEIFFEKYKITDVDEQKAWKETGLLALRPEPKTPSEIERAIKNGWNDPNEINDCRIAEYESEGIKTNDFNPLYVSKNELDKAHRIRSRIAKITDLKDIDKDFLENPIQRLDRYWLPIGYAGEIRIERADKISDLRDKNEDLSTIREELKQWVLDNLEKYEDEKYKFANIEVDWMQFGRNQGTWGNENGETWLDLISQIDKIGDHPRKGSAVINKKIKRTFTWFIINHFLTNNNLTSAERKEYLQEWIDDHKTEQWDIKILSEEWLRDRLTKPEHELKIEDLPAIVEIKNPDAKGEKDSKKEDWGNIDNQFRDTPTLIEAWKDRGFTYEQTKLLIDAGFGTGEYELAEWIRDEKHFSAYQIANYGDKDELSKEFSKSKKPKKELILDEKKTKLTEYFEAIINQYKDDGLATLGYEKELNEYGKNKGHFHTGKDTWRDEINQISDDRENEDTGDFGDTKMSLLATFAEFFVKTVSEHNTIDGKDKKEWISKYMKKHKDPNEIGGYKTFETAIKNLELTIPTDTKELEIKI